MNSRTNALTQSCNSNQEWLSCRWSVLKTRFQQYSSIVLILKAIDPRASTTQPAVLNGVDICRLAVRTRCLPEAKELSLAIVELDPA